MQQLLSECIGVLFGRVMDVATCIPLFRQRSQGRWVLVLTCGEVYVVTQIFDPRLVLFGSRCLDVFNIFSSVVLAMVRQRVVDCPDAVRRADGIHIVKERSKKIFRRGWLGQVPEAPCCPNENKAGMSGCPCSLLSAWGIV